jgi:type IV pilus assembly protein PilE
MRRRETGFTLIELMITIAIVAILSAVAIPAYGNYVVRGRLTEAFTMLSAMQPKAEEFWSNNRTYAGLQLPTDTDNFTYAADLKDSSYTITASGRNKMADFAFTIDQNGNRATTRVPSDWTSSTNCWVDRKGGQCVQ